MRVRSTLLLAALAAAGCKSDVPAPKAAAVGIEYIAHASFRIHTEAGATLLIDPYASRVWLGYDFPEQLLDADAVVITHPHYDHDYGEFIGRAVPWTEQDTVLRDPGTFDVADAVLTGVAGKHADPFGQEFDQKNTIWVIDIDGLRIAHIGDNGPLTDEVVAALGRVDVLMAPIDAEEHIITYATVEQMRAQLSPAVVIPMHYRLPDLESDPSSPDDLGEIDAWLATQTGVIRADGNRYELAADTLPDDPSVLVFEHSPLVTGDSRTAR